jgi:hypothetical protein
MPPAFIPSKGTITGRTPSSRYLAELSIFSNLCIPKPANRILSSSTTRNARRSPIFRLILSASLPYLFFCLPICVNELVSE